MRGKSLIGAVTPASFVIFLSFLVLIRCSSGSNESNGDDGNDSSTSIAGLVRDTFLNLVEGVVVSNGSDTAVTNSDGNFTLTLQAGSDKVIGFSKSGYIPASKMVDVYSNTQTSLSLVLIPEQTASAIDASQGGAVNGIRNSSATIPADAFVDSAGNAVTGSVDVHLTPLDPSDPEEARAYPGDLRGLSLAGEVVRLETFGVLDVTARQNGSNLRLQEGKTIEIRVPVPANGEKPETVPVWYFNNETALWEESSSGEASYDSASNTYVTTISHLSPQNLDRPYIPTCISGLVHDSEGNGVGGALVEAIPNNIGNMSSEVTDLNGYYCMYVERNADLTLRIHTPADDNCPDSMRDGNQCVTEQTIHSGGSGISGGYPADCSIDCARAPNIEIGSSDNGASTTADCNTESQSEDPFRLTCAADLTDLYECFAPLGACTYRVDPYGFSGTLSEITFENGSRMATELDLSGLGTNFYGPSGILCGTITYTGNESEQVISLPSGESYTIRTNSLGQQEIVCPGGEVFTVTPNQSNLMAGCTGTSEELESATSCTAEPGTLGAVCIFDSECDSGYSCCNLQTSEDSCQLATICDILCESDAECGLEICCNIEGYNMCVTPSLCQ